ncbi:TnsD family Tn7-like transposition protein [Gracilibacillus dipsosauri]|nr:TnsD family Tn7-like transposition protein [Gracilibacillus dipsosauri]
MNQIIYFPTLYPGEDFRSIVFRYHTRSGNSLTETSEDLFGMLYYEFPHIPRNMNYFISVLPSTFGYTASYFLENHTFFPFFKAFTSSEKVDDYFDDILTACHKGSKRGGNIAIIRKNPILSEKIRYCPDCLTEDYEVNGECYVHLKHQLTFLDFCPNHFIRLIDRCPVCGDIFSQLNMRSTTFCSKGHSLIKNRLSLKNDLKLKVYNDITFIKNSSMNITITPQYIINKLIIVLGNKNYINYGGVIQKKIVVNDLFSFFTEVEMNKFGYFIKQMKKKKIEQVLTVIHVENNPIFYILLIRFLCESINKFLEYNEPFVNNLPFGYGPWKCINKICSRYNKYVINRCKTTLVKRSTRFKGTFKCPYCELIYIQYINTKNNKNKAYVKVENHGQQWIDKAFKLFVNGKSVSYIQRTMGSDKEKIRSYLKEEILKICSVQIDWRKLNNFSEIPQKYQILIERVLATHIKVDCTSDEKNLETFKKEKLEEK